MKENSRTCAASALVSHKRQIKEGLLAHAVAAEVFRLVEFLVRAANQFDRRNVHFPLRRHDTAADSDLEVLLFEAERRLADGLEHSCRRDDSPVLGGLREHDRELLAAIAGEQLFLADAALDARSQLAQR